MSARPRVLELNRQANGEFDAAVFRQVAGAHLAAMRFCNEPDNVQAKTKMLATCPFVPQEKPFILPAGSGFMKVSRYRRRSPVPNKFSVTIPSSHGSTGL